MVTQLSGWWDSLIEGIKLLAIRLTSQQDPNRTLI
jgi:hypothetical protein